MTMWTEEKLVETYPSFFKNYREDFSKTCLAFGLEIDAGWLGVMADLCAKIKELNPSDDFTFVQVKEKFGGLRVYCHNSNGQIEALIYEAEKEAMKTCEKCGAKNNVTTQGKNWVKTLCDSCHAKREKI